MNVTTLRSFDMNLSFFVGLFAILVCMLYRHFYIQTYESDGNHWKSFWLLYQYDLVYYIIKSSFKQLRWSLYYYDSLFTILERDCADCLECCSWCQNTSSKLNLTYRDLEHVIDQNPWLIMWVPYRCLA